MTLKQALTLTGLLMATPWHAHASAACAALLAQTDEAPAVVGAVMTHLAAGYRARFAEANDQNTFVLDRGEIGACLGFQGMGGFQLKLDAIRSASPGSAAGIQGESFVVRVKEAFAFTRHALGPGHLSLALGMIRDPVLSEIDAIYPLSGLIRPLAERSGLQSVSELGIVASYALNSELLALTVAVTNGEGAAYREQNQAKNLIAVLKSQPLALPLGEAILALKLHVGYQLGAVGVAEVKDSRVFGGFGVNYGSIDVGGELSYAMGHQGRGEIKALAMGFWAAGKVIDPYLGLLLRYDHWNPNLDGSGLSEQTILAGVYSDLAEMAAGRLRSYLAYRYEAFGNNVGPVAGSGSKLDAHSLLLMLEVKALLPWEA